MEIRAAEPDDLPSLLDLWVESWSDAMPSIDFESRRAWLIEHLNALTANGARLLVLRHEAQPIGFVTVDPGSGVLDQLAVALQHQKQGHAQRLLAAAKQNAPRGLTLSVNADNPRAIALYRKEGFRVTGTGQNGRSGLPILHMAWRPDAAKPDC